MAQASMGQAFYRPNDSAVVNVQVSDDGLPVVGAQITATYFYPKSNVSCRSTTDSTGMATCSEEVPYLPSGTIITVEVHVAGPNGESAQTAASYTIN
jgi:phosphatidate phosphatase APP1